MTDNLGGACLSATVPRKLLSLATAYDHIWPSPSAIERNSYRVSKLSPFSLAAALEAPWAVAVDLDRCRSLQTAHAPSVRLVAIRLASSGSRLSLGTFSHPLR